MTKCSDGGLCNRNVLFNRAGTCSNRTDDGSVQHDGYSAAEDDDLCRVASMLAEASASPFRSRSMGSGASGATSACWRISRQKSSGMVAFSGAWSCMVLQSVGL